MESTLVTASGSSDPPSALLEAMECEESLSRMVHGDGAAPCFDVATLDAARMVVDAAQTIGEERARLEALGHHL